MHSTGIRIPIELQNRSMVVRGVTRAISSSAASSRSSGDATGEASDMVRAVKATV